MHMLRKAAMQRGESDARMQSHSEALRAKSLHAPVFISREFLECVPLVASL